MGKFKIYKSLAPEIKFTYEIVVGSYEKAMIRKNKLEEKHKTSLSIERVEEENALIELNIFNSIKASITQDGKISESI